MPTVNFPLTEDQENAINQMNQDFQNHSIGTILRNLSAGTLPVGTIVTADIADLAITTAKLAASLTGLAAKIPSGEITNALISALSKPGLLASLNTTAKGDLVAAINEIKVTADAALPSTTEIKDIRDGQITLNGVSPTRVAFQSDIAATDLGTELETFDLTGVGDGGTVIINPDGAGNQTATFNFAAGNSISAAAPSIDISAGIDDRFDISIRGDAAETVVLTLANCNTGANTAAEMQTKIQALGGNKAAVTVDHNVTEAAKYAIVDSVLGTSSTVVVTPASTKNVTEELKIGTTDSGVETAGTGDVANAAAATAAELAALISSDMTGITASDESGSIRFVSDTAGKDSSLVLGNGTLNAVIGITNADAFYGAQGLGYASDMANGGYRVLLTPNGVTGASLASIYLGVNSLSASEFGIECETVASVIVVDVIIIGDAA